MCVVLHMEKNQHTAEDTIFCRLTYGAKPKGQTTPKKLYNAGYIVVSNEHN